MLLDQHGRDRRASTVEFSCSMRRLTEQHNALLREALGQARKLVEIVERLRCFSDEMAELGADGAGALRRHQQSGGKARAFRVDRCLTLGLFRLAPAFSPDQRHEGDGAVVLFLELIIVDAADKQQRLASIAANRNHQPSANRKLLL
jgi:hypothetical protein